MGDRTLTMANPEVSPSFRRLFFLIGKIILVIFITLSAGWGYGLVILKANVFLDIVHRSATLLMAAAVSGLLARFIIQSQHGRLLSWLAAFVAMTVSMMDLYNLSSGRIGARVFGFVSESVNWDSAWQLALGGLVILLALNAWWKKPAPAPAVYAVYEEEEPYATIPVGPMQVERSARKVTHTRPRRPRKTADMIPASDPAPARLRVSRQEATASNPAPASRENSVTSAPLRKVKFNRASRAVQQSASQPGRRRSKSHGSPIHLVGREEHRCPYCLCVVSPRDPAGVVICPVCHTYHHKACWDVTGACQVPHIHA